MTEEIIERLRSLDLSDGGSHLSAIASCFYQPTFGWTGGSCEILRDLLIEILEGKDVNDDNDHAHAHGCDYGHHRCDQHQVSYDVLGNERHKAVCALRKVPDDIGKSELTYQEAENMIYAALGVEKELIGYYKGLDALRDRLIHLLGGDQPTLSDLYGIWQDGAESESNSSESAHKMTKSVEIGELDVDSTSYQSHESSPMRQENETRITDELRKFKCHIDAGLTPETVLAIRAEINAIADRIDEQFDRICEQQEKVLQATIDSMCEERDRLQERLRAAELGCDANHRLAEANAWWCDDLVDLLRDASREYKDRHYWKQVWHDRAVDLRMERDELQEKCDRLKAKVEHQREQLAVYATMCDFDAIRALKRERNEHKHRADNAEGHVKSLERRLDAVHETYCALLNDAAREFRALTEERDECYQLLPKDSEGEYVHIGDVMEDMFGGTCRVIAVSDTWFIQSGESVCYKTARKFRHHRRQPVTVEQVIRDLTLGKITESQAIERIEGIHGQG